MVIVNIHLDIRLFVRPSSSYVNGPSLDGPLLNLFIFSTQSFIGPSSLYVFLLDCLIILFSLDSFTFISFFVLYCIYYCLLL